MRSQYWIARGRQAVKKIIGTCITCKRLEGISYRSPRTAQLPDFRVNEEGPLNIQALIFVDLYISKQQVIPRRTTLH